MQIEFIKRKLKALTQYLQLRNKFKIVKIFSQSGDFVVVYKMVTGRTLYRETLVNITQNLTILNEFNGSDAWLIGTLVTMKVKLSETKC